MLRLPDPEPPAQALASVPDPPPPTRPSHPETQQAGPVPPPAAPVRKPRSAAAARNPLFRAIDGGLVEPDAEGRANPKRGPVRPARRDIPGDPPPRAARRVRRPLPDKATTAGRVARSAQAQVRPECYGCPVGIAFGTFREASPETLDHLVAASREMISAARSVMEALEAGLDRYGRPGPVQRIDLD